MTDIRLLRDLNEIEMLEPGWNRLLERSLEPTPFLSYEWMTTWLRRFAGDSKMVVAAAFDEDELLALAPMIVRRRGVGARFLEIIGTGKVAGRGMGLADRAGFLVDATRPELYARLLDTLCTDLDDWDVMHLKATPADGALADMLRAAELGSGSRSRELPHDSSPYVPCSGTWADFLASKSKTFRKTMRKTRNRLERLPGYRLQCHLGTDSVDVLPRVFELNQRSWKGQAGSALFESAEMQEFFTDLAVALAPRDGLRVYTITTDTGLVAYEICLHCPAETGDFLVAYDASFDPEMQRFSPGTALSGHILEDAYHDGLAEYDQSRGGHEYKTRWSDLVREERQFVVCRPGVVPFAGYLTDIRLRQLARQMPGITALHDRLTRKGVES